MRNHLLIICPAILLMAFQSQEMAPYNDSIKQEELRPEVFFLANDLLQGRLTNTPGAAIAAEYIKTRFESMGLKPAGYGGTFFHSFNMVTTALGETNNLEIMKPGGPTLKLKPAQGYYPLDCSASGHVRGELVYVGFGITMPDLNWDDYRGKNLSGKIVLALTDEPGENDPNSRFDGVVRSEASVPLRKALWAQEHGAAGIIFVQDVHNHPGQVNFEAAAQRYWPAQPSRFLRLSLAAWMDKVQIPVAQVSPAIGALLVRETQRTLLELSKAAETGLEPLPIPGVEINLTTSVDRHVSTGRNVIGIIEGTDPKLKDEYVIVSGHLDHMGAEGNQIFSGADDNVTGTVATYKIAEAVMQAVKAGQKPRRSLMFAVWEAEEHGLLGAWAYTEDPTRPLDRAVAILNMDLIGRNEEVPEGGDWRFRGLEIQSSDSNKNTINILGTLRCPELKTESEKANRVSALDLRFRYDNNISNLLRRSDHWPFIQNGVPGLWFLTGLHPDYHTIQDRPEKIDYAKMEKVTRMVHQMAWDLAQQDGRPKLQPRK